MQPKKHHGVVNTTTLTVLVGLAICLPTEAAMGQQGDEQRAVQEYNEGVRAYNAGNMSSAVWHWEDALREYERIPDTHRRRADCHKNTGMALLRSDTSDDTLSHAIPTLLDSHAIRTLRDAVSHFENAIELYNHNSRIRHYTYEDQGLCHTQLGVCFARLGERKKAKASWESAKRLYKGISMKDKVRQLDALIGIPDADEAYNEAVRRYNAGDMSSAVLRWQDALRKYERIPDTYRRRADCHKNIGVALLRSDRGRSALFNTLFGSLTDAVSHFEDALELYDYKRSMRHDTLEQQAFCRYQLGLCFARLGQRKKANASWESAKRVYERISMEDKARELEVLIGIPDADEEVNAGRWALKINDVADAKRHFGNALLWYEEVIGDGDRARDIRSLLLLCLPERTEKAPVGSETTAGTTDYETAIERANGAVAKGSEAHRLGRMDEALKHWERAIVILEKIPGTDRERASLLVNMGATLGNMGRYEEAVTRLKQGLRSFEKSTADTRYERASCHHNLGAVACQMGHYEEAIGEEEQALAIYAELKNVVREQAGCHQNIGVALGKMGRYEKALVRLGGAMAMFKRIPNTDREQASCEANIGELAANVGLCEEAMKALARALTAFERLAGTEREQATCHVNIGIALVDMGRYEEAMAHEEKALAIYERFVDTEREQANCHMNIGVALAHTGRFEESKARNESALAMYEKIGGTEREQAFCHMNIGARLTAMGRYEEAIAREERALAELQKISGTENDQADCFAQMGDTHRSKGQLAEAVSCYRVAGATLSLARTLEAVGSPRELDEAARELFSAVSRYGQLRSFHYGTQARMAHAAATAPAYRFLARFLINRSRENWELMQPEVIEWATGSEPRVRYLEAAFHFADAGKARTLIELIQQRPVDVGQDAQGKQLLDEDRQLLAQIGSAHQRKLALPSNAEVSRKELDNQIAEWQQRRRQIEYELKKTYVGKFAAPEFQKAAEIQASLPDELAILQYVVTEDDSRLIILTKGRIAGFDIPIKQEAPWQILSASQGRWDDTALTALATQFEREGRAIGLEGLVRLYRAPMDAEVTLVEFEERFPGLTVRVGWELSGLLLPDDAREFLAKQKARHLVVIPDGPLHLLPFAALPVVPPGQDELTRWESCRFLIEDYVVSYLPSWTMLGAIRSAAAERTAAVPQKEFLALAPSFEAADSRSGVVQPGSAVAALVHSVRGKLGGGPQLLPERGTVAAVLQEYYNRSGLKPLEDTTAEARDSAKPFGRVCEIEEPGQKPDSAAQAVVYLGSAATPKVLEHADQYRRLLLATHGLADSANPWLSCVALSPPPEQSYAMPAYLKAADIIGLKLNADLVTLSACQTALGRLERGEGIVGLSSAFFVAGARSLALTLWEVPSPQTAEISIRFHQLIAEQRDIPAELRNKAEALRQAQREFVASHPTIKLEIERSVEGIGPRKAEMTVSGRHPYFWAGFILVGDWR